MAVEGHYVRPSLRLSVPLSEHSVEHLNLSIQVYIFALLK